MKDEKEINQSPAGQDEAQKKEKLKKESETAETVTHKEAQKVKKELEHAKKQLEALQEELQAAQDEQAQYKDRLLRTAAEFENFKKRTTKEKEQMYADATAGAVAKLLPSLDNLERAVSAESAVEEFRKGVEMTLKQMTEAFAALGVQPMCICPGDPFDPQFHNAVLHVEDESLPENSVADVLQKGYLIGEKVVRHAVVKAAN